MEKQRSFSWKSSRFVVLSLTLSFSLVLLSFFSFWAMHARPVIHQQSYLLLNTPSLSLSFNPLNLQSLTGSLTDSSAYSVNTTDFTDTHFRKARNSSGFVGNRSTDVVLVDREEASTVDSGRTKGFADLGTNFSVSGVNDLSLVDAQLIKPHNSSGFELQRKGSIGENGKFVSSGFVKSPIFKEEDELQRKAVTEEVDRVVSDRGKDDNRHSHHHTRMQEEEQNSTSIGEVDDGIGEKRVKDCDISKGRWVFDESYPLYTNLSCPFIDEGFNCQGNGRKDNEYMKWRWQPQDCDIPWFNATSMLELIRGKRVVFAGDSINRNQWESLLCLLMGAVKDPSKVYETRGRRITKEKGTYSFRFMDYQCTIEYYVSHFLVHESKARIGRKRKGTLRIDTMDKGSSRWRGADILIFNTGNWWSHFKTKAGNNYYQEGKQIYPHLDALTAYRKALVTWATWVDKYINPSKTHVFFRSTAPAHFREGQWNNGGHCREARTPLHEMYIDNPVKDVIAEDVIRTMKTPITFLNVTGLSSYRIDGHPSKYGRNPAKKVSSGEDCSHWCLPGVPDAWNELIYHQLLLKQKTSVYVS